MSRKAALIVLTVLLLCCSVADAAFLGIGRKGGRKGGMFPQDGDVPELLLDGKVLTYKGDKFQELYGTAGNRYIQFGMVEMMSANYIYGAPKRRVNIEIATMENATAAAGLFHHHRGKIVTGQGERLNVGAEGVLDVGRERRNLYFYRANYFVKIVYSGRPPVPSLMPIADFIDGRLPAGRDEKPDGFKYIDIEGINADTIALTPGFTFNISFLPPSVWASAPAGGSPASDLFVVTRLKDKEAAELYQDYFSYLRLHAEYVEEYRDGDIRYVKAVDPNQGRVLFTSYKNALIIAARPDGYEKGEVLIERVMEKIDENRNVASGGGSGGRRSILPWRRRTVSEERDESRSARQPETAAPARSARSDRSSTADAATEYEDGLGGFDDFDIAGTFDRDADFEAATGSTGSKAETDGGTLWESMGNDSGGWESIGTESDDDQPGVPFFLPPPPSG
ncbi:MAG: hypothetical protein LIQ31_11610 [Planctomycetes bacterium]|nr:hypothetical protein [Planctomycetota bacterium]